MIAQELLGQKKYQIAVEYELGREDLPPDKEMWLRYCKRAVAYNIDLALHALYGKNGVPKDRGVAEYWLAQSHPKRVGACWEAAGRDQGS